MDWIIDYMMVEFTPLSNLKEGGYIIVLFYAIFFVCGKIIRSWRLKNEKEMGNHRCY